MGDSDSVSESESAFGDAEGYTQDELKQLKNLNAIVQVCSPWILETRKMLTGQ